jgi:hypothetical protein
MPSPTSLNPQILGRAENAHRAILERVLAPTAITYNHWVVLTLTAQPGGTVDRDELAARATSALKTDNTTVDATITDLHALALLTEVSASGSEIKLTPNGQERYTQIKAAVSEIVARLYNDLPADDLATAGRVLTIITARADAELAA